MNDTSNSFKNINLPGIHLSNITWPIHKRSPVITYSMEIHPKTFGNVITDPFKNNCEAIWKEIID